MRRSFHRHPVAILREICGKHQEEFADLIGCSRIYVQKIENRKERLSPKLAQRIFHETGVSLDWLRGGDPTAPPISSRGEEYKKEIYERAQAEKKYYDRPHPWYQNNDALNYCGRVAAILQSASKNSKYYMAMWKLGAALDELQKEFGQEPGAEWLDFLKPVIHQGKDPLRAAKRFNAAPASKQSSKKKPRRS